jgi:hypothetical protein
VKVVALKGSLVWAAETLRESLVRDNFATALAQAREIARTLEQLIHEDGGREASDGSDSHGRVRDIARLQAQIDFLEAQVQAWMHAAEALRKKNQRLI